MSNEAEKMNEADPRESECTVDQERAERVARVIEAVRSGTYQVRSDVVARRLIDSMLHRPKKR